MGETFHWLRYVWANISYYLQRRIIEIKKQICLQMTRKLHQLTNRWNSHPVFKKKRKPTVIKTFAGFLFAGKVILWRFFFISCKSFWRILCSEACDTICTRQSSKRSLGFSSLVKSYCGVFLCFVSCKSSFSIFCSESCDNNLRFDCLPQTKAAQVFCFVFNAFFNLKTQWNSNLVSSC